MARSSYIYRFKRTNPDITVIAASGGDLGRDGPFDLLVQTMAEQGGQATWPGRK